MKNKAYVRIQLSVAILGLLTLRSVGAQTPEVVTLDSCHHWALQNYPLTSQHHLLEQTRDLTLENIGSRNYPQLKIAGQASYQSVVPELSLNIPGIDIPQVPHDQYNASVEVIQPLSQFSTTNAEKKLSRTRNEIQHKTLDVSLYPLHQRVNTLYFGILLLEGQIEQSRITQEDLRQKINQLSRASEFGTILDSDVDQLRAEELRLDQQIFTAQSQKNYLINILEQLTGRNWDVETTFQRPQIPASTESLHRPELDLFELQRKRIDQEVTVFESQLKPRLNLFARGGVGRPALNFFDDDFSPYYMVGVQFTWDLTSRYNKQRKMQLWDVQKRMIDTETETFRFNTKIKVNQHDEEIARYQELITMDQNIIDLRTSIRQSAGQRLERGVLTPVDYTSILREEEKARQSRTLNEILLLQSYYNRQYENGQ